MDKNLIGMARELDSCQAQGFRCNSGTEDLFWQLAVRVEKAILAGDELFVVAFDFRNCFEMIPLGILFGILTEMGLSNRILAPMQTMYASFKRRWKLSKNAVGTGWTATNGILQGCGVSVVLLNCATTLWLQAVSCESSHVVMLMICTLSLRLCPLCRKL